MMLKALIFVLARQMLSVEISLKLYRHVTQTKVALDYTLRAFLLAEMLVASA